MATAPRRPDDDLSEDQKAILHERNKTAEEDNKVSPTWDEYKSRLLEKKPKPPVRNCTP